MKSCIMSVPPPSKGDALYAMELALSLEKLNFTKLRELHAVADAAEDAQVGACGGGRCAGGCNMWRYLAVNA